METVSCNVIYVDRSVARDRYLRRGDQHSDRDVPLEESGHLAENIRLLLEVFGEGILFLPPQQGWIDVLIVKSSPPVQHRQLEPDSMAQPSRKVHGRPQANSLPY